MTGRPFSRRLVATLALVVGGVACSSTAQNTPVDYQIVFPSTASAVATDTLEVSVFPAASQDACQELFAKRASGQGLPTPVATLGPITPCDVFNGKVGDRVPVDFGLAAFLAVGRRAGKELLLGCEVRFVTAEVSPVVRLTLFDVATLVPATTCARLSEYCANACK